MSVGNRRTEAVPPGAQGGGREAGGVVVDPDSDPRPSQQGTQQRVLALI